MAAIQQLHPALEAQCRRIAALSMAIQRITGAAGAEEVLDLAEAIDAHFGWEPFGAADDEPNEFAQAALTCLRVAGPEDLDRAIQHLPVFPVAAQRALEVILRPYWNVSELAAIAGSDQTLAANLVRAANSCEFAPVKPIETIPQAITYIGSDRTSRILYAAAVQPLFNSPSRRDLWHHSVASAGVAGHLAEVSRALDPQKAFLAGLVHDVGMLAMTTFPAPFPALFRQLTQLGCEAIVAERALAGISHAEAGARAVTLWKFPAEFGVAIEHHHSPERTTNKLAALLYLTEQWTDSSEDAPSAARFRFALQSLGIEEEQFRDLAPPADSGLSALL